MELLIFQQGRLRASSLTPATASFTRRIDNGSDVPPNTKNAAIKRGVSNFDRTHILSASYIYEVPRITRQRFAGLLINGWQISGITRINSGPAFDVVMSQDFAGIGGTQNQRPNLIAPVT